MTHRKVIDPSEPNGDISNFRFLKKCNDFSMFNVLTNKLFLKNDISNSYCEKELFIFARKSSTFEQSIGNNFFLKFAQEKQFIKFTSNVHNLCLSTFSVSNSETFKNLVAWTPSKNIRYPNLLVNYSKQI